MILFSTALVFALINVILYIFLLFNIRLSLKERMKNREALVKHIAMSPRIYRKNVSPSGYLPRDVYNCPRCDAQYKVYYDYYKYCPECGQKFDRSVFPHSTIVC